MFFYFEFSMRVYGNWIKKFLIRYFFFGFIVLGDVFIYYVCVWFYLFIMFVFNFFVVGYIVFYNFIVGSFMNFIF